MMFNLFKKKQPPPAPPQPPSRPQTSIRDTMLGDMSPAEWPQGNRQGQPWSMFVEARDEVLVKHNSPEAIKIYHKILETPGLESRHYLQAWHFLRKLGETPPPEVATKVYGVVVDVHLEKGLEFVSAYADHHARYMNYTGGGVIWEAPDASLNDQVDELLQACAVAAAQVPPLDKKVRPGPPSEVDAVQICILTPSGIRHGIGTFASWAKDATGGRIVTAATNLMKSMVDKSSAQRQ